MRLLAALAASTGILTAHAQNPPPAGAPVPPPLDASSQPASPATPPPPRGNIAPILDIRIEGEGIRLPASRDDAPPPQKPPAK